MNALAAGGFHWMSALGISVALFLGFGALNILVGLVIPGLTRTILARKMGAHESPQHQVDMESMLWLAFGIFQLGVAWFALKNGEIWALWVLAAADLAQILSWAFYGAHTRDWYSPLFLYAAIFTGPAIVLGWIGLG